MWQKFDATIRQPLVAGILVVLLFIILGFISLKTMYAVINRVYNPLQTFNNTRSDYVTKKPFANLGLQKVATIKTQYITLENLKSHHKELGKVYYSNYYTFTVLLTVSTILAAVLLFVIIQKGWEDTNALIKTLFFILFAISTFFGIMSVSLSQQENYENNFKQYILYDKVQTNIISFLGTSGKYDSLKNEPIIDSFIVSVNNDIKNYSQFFIKIDANKISLEDISSKLGKSVNGK
ncbi:MAG: hypothetical protein EAZ16_05175 [Sphingobacteriales bacterium]|nr:MAG: hypothetical protein EAZ16_05175 [Sphingobacteriales bacterium]